MVNVSDVDVMWLSSFSILKRTIRLLWIESMLPFLLNHIYCLQLAHRDVHTQYLYLGIVNGIILTQCWDTIILVLCICLCVLVVSGDTLCATWNTLHCHLCCRLVRILRWCMSLALLYNIIHAMVWSRRCQSLMCQSRQFSILIPLVFLRDLAGLILCLVPFLLVVHH